MSTHKSFVIFGSGGMGSFIIEEFIKLKESGAIATVRIASRSNAITESHPEWFARGGELVVVDYSSEPTLLAALDGVEVAITALNIAALERQRDIAEAARSAGVKLFVPTEYGIPTDHATTGVLSAKTHLNNWFRGFGLPYTRVICGVWPEYAFTPMFGFDFASGKATFGGNGDYRVSCTTREDTARFMGYAFTHLTTSELSGKTLRMEGDNLSFNEIISAYEKKTGKAIEVTRIPREVLAEKAAAGDISATYFHYMDVHGGEAGKPLDNDLFPGWNPKKALDFILKAFKS